MSRSLPSLDHLRAFEAAGRQLSFKAAATELNVTPAAIGQRIRSLEAQLGTPLFVRKVRQIEMTESGKALLADVADGLSIIRAGILRLDQKQSNRVLNVSTTNTFAETCLLPNLPEFLQSNPGHDVRIISTDRRLNPEDDDIDLFIRFGRGKDHGLKSRLLTQDVYVPVASPDFLSRQVKIQTADQLVSLPLIETDWQVEKSFSPRWRTWFANRGLPASDVNAQIRVTVEGHAIRAASTGQGVALVNRTFISSELASGTLIQLLPGIGDHVTEFRHRLLWHEARYTTLCARFSEWLLEHLSDRSISYRTGKE
ncbi:MAG: LysR substrate-binding domain-containing protein [Pseudomonadota bacterium]